MERTGGRGADIVIQGAGTAAIGEGLAFARQGARYLSIGGGGGSLTMGAGPLSGKMLTIIGVRSAEGRHYHQALSFLARQGAARFEPLLTTRYSLTQVGDALESMAALREIKPVILPKT